MPGRLQIVQALGLVDNVQCSDCFQFDKYGPFHQQVRRIFTDGDALIPDCDPMLLLQREACQTKLMRKRILIQFFKKPWPKLIADLKRAADDSLHNVAEPTVLICVHLWFHSNAPTAAGKPRQTAKAYHPKLTPAPTRPTITAEITRVPRVAFSPGSR